MVAPHERAAASFDAALAIPGAEQWPFDLARVQLLYGEWLRRDRSDGQARAYLGTALDTFQRLGARPWQVRGTSTRRQRSGPGSTAARPSRRQCWARSTTRCADSRRPG